MVSPGTVTVAAANWVSVLGSVSAIAVPCLTLYAAIALRVLDVRTTVRVSARRLLTRGGLAVLTAGPLAALAGLLASRADLPVRAVLADPLSQGFVGAAAAGLVALAWRERLLAGLDGWVAPETADQRRALAAAAAELGQATDAAGVETAIARAARHGAGVPAAMLSALDASAERFAAPGGALAPLPRTSLLAGVLAEIGSSLPVDPNRRHTAFELLPPGEAAWVTATGAAHVVPIAGSGAALAGLLVVGRRADGARLRPVDLSFLEALAASAGLALARLRQPGPAGEAPPARACQACGRVAAAADAGARCDACGGAWAEAPLPALVSGKLAVERRIGAGGMGTVYRARDIGLDRVVAVKTLDGVSAAGLVQLRREAQAMAASAHPGVAQVYSLETWRGRPLLVMEHLDGGTLAARLGRGPLAPGQAVWVVTAVAEALDALHAAGYRHGDVKPSNIGLTAKGSVKLLDFGLAEITGGGRPLGGGTVAYLSPEALGGRPAGAADDVWALGVVLYEMVAGRRPFGGATVKETVDAIRNQRFRTPPAARPNAPDADAREAVLSFAGEMLTAPASARPATAGALAAAVRGSHSRRAAARAGVASPGPGGGGRRGDPRRASGFGILGVYSHNGLDACVDERGREGGGSGAMSGACGACRGRRAGPGLAPEAAANGAGARGGARPGMFRSRVLAAGVAAAVLSVAVAAGCRSAGNGALVGASGLDVAVNSAPAFAVGVVPTTAPPVAVGTPIGFRVSSSEAGFGHLYLVNADGGVTMLAENLPVAAGAQVEYPRPGDGIVIRASLPAGVDRVVFLVTRQPFGGFADSQGSTLTRPMALASTAGTFLRRLNQATQQMPAASWAVAETRVQVVE